MRSLAVIALGLVACGPPLDPPADEWVWDLPHGFPTPAVPADNPMSRQKVALGKSLFSSTELSRNRQGSCASCHDRSKAFSDGLQVAVGSTGEHHRRNAQALVNVAWAATLTWANPLMGTLEQQALVPLFNEAPVELGWAGHEEELSARLSGDADLAAQFDAAYPGEGVTLKTITGALASFERTLISGDAPYDRWAAGDVTAMSADAQAGLQLFNNEDLECYHCHNGFTFSDSVTHEQKTALERPFHNTGLYDVDGLGSYPAVDTGLEEVTSRVGDMGKFRAPTLRNLRFTAPYMHDGSLATLDDVLDAYAAGGHARQVSGHPSPLQSDLVRGFTLTAEQRRQVLAFLDALNDEAFVAP